MLLLISCKRNNTERLERDKEEATKQKIEKLNQSITDSISKYYKTIDAKTITVDMYSIELDTLIGKNLLIEPPYSLEDIYYNKIDSAHYVIIDYFFDDIYYNLKLQKKDFENIIDCNKDSKNECNLSIVLKVDSVQKEKTYQAIDSYAPNFLVIMGKIIKTY